MMRILHDPVPLADYFARNPGLHLYELGDLDDAFWPRTTWFARMDDGVPADVALLYAAATGPVLLALCEQAGGMRDLLDEVLPFLPRQFYAHLSPGLSGVIEQAYRSTFHGEHIRMVLVDAMRIDPVDTSETESLDFEHVHEVKAFYAAAYPGNWFDPAMLHAHSYFGIRRIGSLVAVAGVHVFSSQFRVAALGNIATHPDHRGQGLARAVTARLCRSLLAYAHIIGLNVASDNRAALACYAGLGFEPVASYEEHLFTARV